MKTLVKIHEDVNSTVDSLSESYNCQLIEKLIEDVDWAMNLVKMKKSQNNLETGLRGGNINTL